MIFFLFFLNKIQKSSECSFRKKTPSQNRISRFYYNYNYNEISVFSKQFYINYKYLMQSLQWKKVEENQCSQSKDQKCAKSIQTVKPQSRNKIVLIFVSIAAIVGFIILMTPIFRNSGTKNEIGNMENELLKIADPFLQEQTVYSISQTEKIPERIMEQLDAGSRQSEKRVYLSYRCLLNPQKYSELEKQYNEKHYKIAEFLLEIPICVLVYANNYTSEELAILLKSIYRQTYSNYQIYVYNAEGEKNSVLFNNETKIINNVKKLNCPKGSIFIPIKNKGQLIGLTLFKKLNSLYQTYSEIEGTYSSLLRYSFEMKKPFAKIQTRRSISQQLRARLISQAGFVTFRLKEVSHYEQVHNFQKVCSNSSLYNSLMKWKLPKFYLTEEFDFYISSESKEIEDCVSRLLAAFNKQQFFKAAISDKDLYKFQGDEQKMIALLKRAPEKPSIWPFHFAKQQTEAAIYSFRMAVAIENVEIQRAGYRIYDQKYKISQYPEQLPICVISSGRNLVMHNAYKKYIKSLGYLNYTNYKAVYVDDASDDGTVEKLRNYMLSDFPHLENYLTVVENKQRIRSTGNRFIAVREHCSENDIVIDYDADDQLVGVNILKLFSAFYQQNNDKWLIYTKSVGNNHRLYEGSSRAVDPELFKDYSFRLYPFVINHLRSFPRKIFMKLNPVDFQDLDGVYFPYVGDFYIYCAIAELSGPQRILFIDQPSVYYKTGSIIGNVDQKQFWARSAFQQPPFMQLQSLDSQPEHTQIRMDFAKKQEMIEESVQYYRDLRKYSETLNLYNPTLEHRGNEQEIQSIVNAQSIKIIASNKNLQKLAALSYELKINRTQEMYNLQKYYYDTRYNIEKHRNSETSIFVVVEATADLKQIEAFFDSLNFQQYSEYTVLLLYKDELEKKNTFQILFKNYPWLIEVTEFLKADLFESFEQVKKKYNDRPAIFIKTSIYNEIIGTRTFKYINSIFRSNLNMRVAVSWPLLHYVDSNALEVREEQLQEFPKSNFIAYYFKDDQALKVNSSEIFVISEMLSVIEIRSIMKTVEKNQDKEKQMGKLKLIKENWAKIYKDEEIKKMLLFQPNYELAMAYEISKDSVFNQLQLYSFQRKYGELVIEEEEKLCIVAFGKNLMKNDQHKKFVNSITRQKYANYAVVYIDLDSNDGTADQILSEFKKVNKGEKIRKIYFDKQSSEEKLTKLKSSVIGQSCQQDELVVEISANGELIGENVFSLVNLNMKKNPYLWFTVFNSIVILNEKPYGTSSLKPIKNWDIFNLEKVVVYKKFLRFVAQQSNANYENLIFQVMSQLSGARMLFLSEYVYLVRNSAFYAPAPEQEKTKHYQILIKPYIPLRFQKDATAVRVETNPLTEHFPYEEGHSTIFSVQLISTKKIKQAEEALEKRRQQKLLMEATTPLGKNVENKKSDTMYLYFRLKLEPQNPTWLNAEYYHASKEYGIDKIAKQLPICVISVGRNIKSGDFYIQFIDSLARLNYTNFRVFYEDESEHGAEEMRQYALNNYPQFNQKLNIIKNTSQISSKSNLVRNYCSNADEIIFDMDINNYLLGRQFFKILNSIYQKGFWVVWFNYFSLINQVIVKGESHQISAVFLREHTYRRKSFATVGPRSFLRSLFLKIEQKEFKQENGTFYSSLVELAGPKRIKYVPETPSFSTSSSTQFSTQFSPYSSPSSSTQFSTQGEQSKFVAANQVPYLELKNMESPAERIKLGEKQKK